MSLKSRWGALTASQRVTIVVPIGAAIVFALVLSCFNVYNEARASEAQQSRAAYQLAVSRIHDSATEQERATRAAFQQLATDSEQLLKDSDTKIITVSRANLRSSLDVFTPYLAQPQPTDFDATIEQRNRYWLALNDVQPKFDQLKKELDEWNTQQTQKAANSEKQQAEEKKKAQEQNALAEEIQKAAQAEAEKDQQRAAAEAERQRLEAEAAEAAEAAKKQAEEEARRKAEEAAKNTPTPTPSPPAPTATPSN